MWRVTGKEDRLGWFVLAILFLLILLPLVAVIVQVLLPGIFFGQLTTGDLSLLLEVFRRPFGSYPLKIPSCSGLAPQYWPRYWGVHSPWYVPGSPFPQQDGLI